MSQVQNLEMRVDRDLINPRFDSYKLSLDSLAVVQTLPHKPATRLTTVRSCSEEQYAFDFVKLFGQTNLLVQDPFDPELVFLVDSPEENDDHHVTRIWKVMLEERTPELMQVFELAPAPDKIPSPNDYNVSLEMCSEDFAVMSDGSGALVILGTKSRKSGSVWEKVHEEELLGKGRQFVVACAKAVEQDSVVQIHVLVQYVEEASKVDGLNAIEVPKKTHFVNVVEWLTIAKTSDEITSSHWRAERTRRFAFFGTINYLALSESASHLLCSTDKAFRLISDSAGNVEEVMDVTDEVKPSPPPFYWMQGVEDIVVWFMLPETATKKDIKVTLKPRELSVSFCNETRLCGDLWNILDSDSLTWTIQKGKLEINVSKANQGMIWQRLVASGQDGEEVNNPGMVDAIHKQFCLEDLNATGDAPSDAPPAAQSVISQDLEECDAVPEESFSLCVFAGKQNKLTHRAPEYQWLFNLRYASRLAPSAICLRNDVDGLVWQPEEEGDDVRFHHVGTFPAFGYVQASKEQRKYTVAAPDLSFVAICDRTKHVFIYRQPTPLAAEFELRNRKSGERVAAVAKQQVVSLESADEIEGAVATNSCLLVLTQSTLFTIRVNN